MKTTTSSKGNIVAIITMMFLFAMISFVTNLAAPVGVIWKNTFAGGENANTIGMLGNAMNFLAYLFMGIPSGKMLAKIGYKNTAMTGVATGIAGLVLQFLSGTCSSAELGFSIYLLGAFVCGFSVCMLNTVVNPMINLLGGGGNRGNQLNLIGGTLNSLRNAHADARGQLDWRSDKGYQDCQRECGALHRNGGIRSSILHIVFYKDQQSGTQTGRETGTLALGFLKLQAWSDCHFPVCRTGSWNPRNPVLLYL